MPRIRRLTQRRPMPRIMEDHPLVITRAAVAMIRAMEPTDPLKEALTAIIRLTEDHRLRITTDTTMIDPTTTRLLIPTRSSRRIRLRTRMDTRRAVDRITILTRRMPAITVVTLVPTTSTSGITTTMDTVTTITASRRTKRVE